MADDTDKPAKDPFALWNIYSKGVKPLKDQQKECLPLEADNIVSKDIASQEKSLNLPAVQHSLADFADLKNKQPLKSSASWGAVEEQKLEKSTYHFKAEKNAKKRMKRGAFEYDAKIDLHGYSQEQAYDRLRTFINSNYERQKRRLLVITGRGRFCYDRLAPSGILIQTVPKWLKEVPFASMISIIEKASPKDGGEGALYVILRKQGGVKE